MAYERINYMDPMLVLDRKQERQARSRQGRQEGVTNTREGVDMSNQKTAAQSGGVGFFGILALIFIGLKLAEVGAVATWSWWWVLSPLWMPFALIVPIAIIFYLVALVVRGR